MGYRGHNRSRNSEKRREKSERNDGFRRERGEASSRKERNERLDLERRVRKNLPTAAEIQENEDAIKAFKARDVMCAICGKSISDISDAMTDRSTGNPAHFDCVLDKINANEKLGPNEKVTYIGQGKFAILYFDNPHDLRKFSIRKTIEWENQEKRGDWRDEMAGLFSKVH